MKNFHRLWMITIVLLTWASLLSTWAASWITEASGWHTHTFLVINKAKNLLSNLKDSEIGQQRYLLLGIAISAMISILVVGGSAFHLRRLGKEIRRKAAFQSTLLNSADAAIISTTPEGVITSINHGVEQLFGYQAEELVGKQSLILFHDADEIAARAATARPQIEPGFETLVTLLSQDSNEPLEWIYLHKDGTRVPVQLSISAMHDNAGKLIGFLCLAINITLHKEAEARLKHSEKFTSSVLDALSKQFCVLDEGGNILAVNRPWLDFERDPDGDAQTPEIGQNYPALLDAGLAKNRGGNAFSEGIRSVLNGTESSFSLEYSYLIQSTQYWFSGRVVPFPDQELGSVIVIYENISDYMRLEHRFRHAVESAPHAIVMVNESGMIVMVNAQTEAYFGYTRAELLGQPIEILVPERFRSGHVGLRQAYCAAPQVRPLGAGREFYGRRKDGSEFPIELGLSVIDSHEEILVLSTIIDITERGQVQEALKASESALKETQRLAGISAWKWDMPTGTHFWSEGIYHIDDLDPILPPINYPEIQQYFTPTSWGRLNTAMENSLTEGVPYKCDAEVVRADGSHCWIIARGEGMRDAAGNITNLHGTVQDITERKLANDKLQTALNEKDMLLKEVYHRVKNNLQVVSSLINLQAGIVKDQETVRQLKQSADRIKSMALIHEKLYQSKNLAKIDFSAYIHDLVEHLLFSHGVHSSKTNINLEIDDLFIDVDTAIPCGLIINELLSNALKHAFPNDRHGEIGISFRQDQDDCTLIISDNGIGFPTDLDFKHTTSLGLQLVNTLASQLRGQLTLDKTDGSTFTIRFIKA